MWQKSIKLESVLDIQLLNRMVSEGYVRVGTHPLYPELRIYGYTQTTAFANEWNSVTNQCRGLITAVIDGKEYVIARGFNKFHNIDTAQFPETHFANLPLEQPAITVKMDGSLGIVYFWDNKIHVATRGSFDSDQARWATAWIRGQQQMDALASMYEEQTLVAEIIYAANQIVCSYNFEGMVALAVIDNATGRELSRDWLEQAAIMHGMRVVNEYQLDLESAMSENTANAEGYVATWPSTGLKVKIKFEEYCRLHRIVTGLNPRSVWEMLAAGENAKIANMINDVTLGDGFRTWLTRWYAQLIGDHDGIVAQAQHIYENRPQHAGVTQKELALYFKQPKNDAYSAICFAMARGRDFEPIVWKKLRPQGNATFRVDGGE